MRFYNVTFYKRTSQVRQCPFILFIIFSGSTTLLTSCTIGITGRSGIPKVPYSTALDVFLLMCFSFVFAALVEYAGVNYFTKTGQVMEVIDDEDVSTKESLFQLILM